MAALTKYLPGAGLCTVIAAFAWAVVNGIPALEVMGAPVLAILTGMVLGLIRPAPEWARAGIAFTSKRVLQAAVVLLGFGLDLRTVGAVGRTSLPVILATISTALAIAFLLQRLLRVPAKAAVLIGVGSSICGGSAIAATAPVIEADHEEIAQAISVIFLFNVVAAVLFPTLGTALGLSNESFGLFAGTAINDTSSVTAAASTWDTMHQTGGTVLEYATIVKLTRTLAIIPITLGLSIYRAGRDRSRGLRLGSVLPMFVVYFVAASVATTLLSAVFTGEVLVILNGAFSALKTLSKFFIVMAMTAVGLSTNLLQLIRTGKRPILLGFCCWISIIAVSLGLQTVLGL